MTTLEGQSSVPAAAEGALPEAGPGEGGATP